eukprot:SAG11_NODE_8868_length_968_cov_1.063291_2_plen_131_part_01
MGLYAESSILHCLDAVFDGCVADVKLSALETLSCLAEVESVSRLIGQQGTLAKIQELTTSTNRKLQYASNTTLRVLAKCPDNRVELAELQVGPLLTQLCELIKMAPSNETASALSDVGKQIAVMCKANSNL